MPYVLASRTRISRARLRSLASVGNITFLGCTVVSTMTSHSCAGLTAPVLVAIDRLSCKRALTFSSLLCCSTQHQANDAAAAAERAKAQDQADAYNHCRFMLKSSRPAERGRGGRR